MSVYIALLRAVNLGGDTVVKMDGLRRLVERTGFTRVRTVGASGNVVFRGGEVPTDDLASRLEARLARALGRTTRVFVRTSAEWKVTIDQNPFREEAVRDPSHLTCWALREAPTPARWRELTSSIPGRERAAGAGRECYLYYPDGIGRSRVTSALVERALGTQGTARNWNTVLRLSEIAGDETK